MAHIFDLAPSISPYTNGRKNEHPSGLPVQFPATPAFQGMNKPSRFEGSVMDLEVTGTIPLDIDGTFFRVQPDARFPPIFEDDIHFNGDGSVTAVRISNGHADMQQRYVHTERYTLETAARRALFGRYRNPFTDSETVRGVIRTAANTNVVFWRGVLLAMKEDGPPYAMDPATLDTLGRYDFDGQITAPTFTAHPKIDPATGEMVCWAYEAGGNGSDCSKDVVVWTIDADGKKISEDWYTAPFAGMIHDAGLSENWLVLPLTPIKMDYERMKRGGNKFAWDPDEDQWYGLVPRRRKEGQDIKWFRADNGFQGHIAGCYELPDGKVVVDLTVADGNVFFWFPPDPKPGASGGASGGPQGAAQPPAGSPGGPPPGPGHVAKRNALSSPTCRWVIDPSAPTESRIEPAIRWMTNGEFSRLDERFLAKPYTHFWQAKVDPKREYDIAKCGPPVGGLFNCLSHCTWEAGEGESAVGLGVGKAGIEEVVWAGPRATFQEPTFIPKRRSADGQGEPKEGEGYLIALVNRLDELRNDVAIFDALNLSKGPLALIHLPVKLKLGLHGNWVDRRDMEDWEERIRQQGGVKVATEPLPWQVKEREEREAAGVNGHGQNGTNGTNGTHATT